MSFLSYINKLKNNLTTKINSVNNSVRNLFFAISFSIPVFLYSSIPFHKSYAEELYSQKNVVTYNVMKDDTIKLEGEYLNAAKRGLWGVLENLGVKDSLPSFCRVMNEYNHLRGEDYLCVVNEGNKRILKKGKDGIPDPILHPNQELIIPYRIASKSRLEHKVSGYLNPKEEQVKPEISTSKQELSIKKELSIKTMPKSSLETIVDDKTAYNLGKTRKEGKKSRFPFEILGTCLGLLGLGLGVNHVIALNKKRKRRAYIISKIEKGVSSHYLNLKKYRELTSIDENYCKTMVDVIMEAPKFNYNPKALAERFGIEKNIVKKMFSDYIASRIWTRHDKLASIRLKEYLPSIRFRREYFDNVSWATFVYDLIDWYYNPVMNGEYISLKKLAQKLEDTYGVKISVSSIIKYAKQSSHPGFDRKQEYLRWKSMINKKKKNKNNKPSSKKRTPKHKSSSNKAAIKSNKKKK